VPSLLSTIMAGRELRQNIDGTSEILYVGFNAAGGSYRVLHNFWIDLLANTASRFQWRCSRIVYLVQSGRFNCNAGAHTAVRLQLFQVREQEIDASGQFPS